MNTAPAELLKEYVKSQQFTSTAEIMTAMKEMFRDVVQTVMEVELDEELGRERCQRAEASEATPNYRNGYSRKTVKTQLGEVDIKVPRDRKGSYEPKIIRWWPISKKSTPPSPWTRRRMLCSNSEKSGANSIPPA